MYEECKQRKFKNSFMLFIVLIMLCSFSQSFYAYAQGDLCVFTSEPVDLMDDFDRWIPHEVEREGVWDSGVDVPLNDEGYPRVVPFKSGLQDYVVKTILIGDGHFLRDDSYSLTFKGSGKIKLGFDAEEKVYSVPGEYDVLVIGSGKGVYLEIMESDIEDPIRDVHFYAPVEKELKKCDVNDSDDAEGYNSSYITVSDSGLDKNETYLKSSENKWENKLVKGLIIFFVILAFIYILK